MRLGAPVFLKTEDPAEFARAHRAQGYRAAYCPGWLKAVDTDAIRAARDAFAAEDVEIAEVGAWGNLIGPDPEERRRNVERAVERLALAEEIGARCCVDYSGTYDPETSWGPHPQNMSREAFDRTVETIRHVIDAVNPTRTVFALEMMQWVWPQSADDYVALIEAIDRPGFGVHLDPVNVINSPLRYYDTGAIIRDCFEKLGPQIVSCHGKDVIMEKEAIVVIRECRPGTGTLNYRTYLRELSRLPQQPPLMLEHLPNEAEYHLARDYVVSVARDVGLSFE